MTEHKLELKRPISEAQQEDQPFVDRGYINYSKLEWGDPQLSTSAGLVETAPTNRPHRRSSEAQLNFDHDGRPMTATVRRIETITTAGHHSGIEIDTLIADTTKQEQAGVIVYLSANDPNRPIEFIPRIPDGTSPELAQMAIQNGLNSIAEASRLVGAAIEHRVYPDRVVFPGLSPTELEVMLSAMAYRKSQDGATTVFTGVYSPR